MIFKFHLLCILIQSLTGYHKTESVKNQPIIETLRFDNQLQRVVYFKSEFKLSQTDEFDYQQPHLYIGGTNNLYLVSINDFKLVAQIKTGPNLDHPKCLPEPAPCEFNRTLSDNINKILLVPSNNDTSVVLSCGSTFQGMCSIVKPGLKASVYIGSGSESINYLASKKSNMIYILPNMKFLMVAAHEYDDRPLSFSPPALSFVKLSFKPSLSFKYLKNVLGQHSILDIHPNFKTKYEVKYIYGFTYSNYNYFLKRHLNLDSNQIETRLARFCMNDTTLTTYIEITLNCDFDTIPFDYGLTAYLGPLYHSLAQRFNVPPEEDKVLYVSFASSTSSHDINLSYGSRVCVFPLFTLNNHFDNEISLCSRPDLQSHLLTIFHGDPQRCSKTQPLFCFNPDNPYIEGHKAYRSNFATVKYSNGLITSLVCVIIDKKPFAIFGTKDGKIIKWSHSDELHSHQFTEEMIEPNPALDEKNQIAYFVSGSTLIKYPYDSCAIYEDCGSCLTSTSLDKNCAWCTDIGCIKNDYFCPTVKSNRSCTPKLLNFWPKNGPLAGGTTLTINGKDLSQGLDRNVIINVSINNHSCEVTKAQPSVINCLTSQVSEPQFGPVYLDITDSSYVLGYDIKGQVNSSDEFTYLEPVLNSIEPNFTPFTQPALITLKGENLDIGSHRSVFLSQIECKVTQFNSTSIKCIPGKYEQNLISNKNIELHIDKALLLLNTTEFTYVPDAAIKEVSPKFTTATSSNEISFFGENLNSIYNPKLAITINDERDSFTLSSSCQTVNPTKLTCSAPLLPFHLLPLNSVIHSEMLLLNNEGEPSGLLKSLKDKTLTYYPDPVFEIKKEILTIDPKDGELKIKGQWLNTKYINFIIKNLRDNLTLECHNLTQVSYNTIICFIDTSIGFSEDEIWQVTALVGQSKQKIGSFQFLDVDSTKKDHFLAFFIFTPFITLALLTFVIIWVLREKGYIFKQTRPTPDVFYRSSPFQRQGSENEYHSHSQDIALPLLSRPNHYEVDEQTKAELVADNILFSREYLEVTTELIGKGQFGIVTKGYLRLPGKDEQIEVAVKKIRRRSNFVTQEVGEAFLKEGLRMKDLAHENVISLIGICFEPDGAPVVITPYMHHGDLYSYLREEEREFMLIELLNFGIQVAEGMNYLAQIKFVHRDLAARNCMIDKNLTVKVADFGLARDVYLENFYSETANARKQLPIRWMAIESIEKGIYTIKTDVWSFGVLLWELVTRCSEPPFYGEDNILLSLLKFGRRLPQPDYCPDSIYKIMLDCWNQEPDKRPMFAELVAMIKAAIQRSQEIYLKLKKEQTINYCNFPISNYYNQGPMVNDSTLTLPPQSSIASSSKY